MYLTNKFVEMAAAVISFTAKSLLSNDAYDATVTLFWKEPSAILHTNTIIKYEILILR